MGSGWEYRVRVEGRIGQRWLAWFDGLDINATDEDAVQGIGSPATTTLTGVLPDQAALAGLLQKLYTLGLPLVEVRRKEAERVDNPAREKEMGNQGNEIETALRRDGNWRKGG